MANDHSVIVSGVRTPIGTLGGSLATVPAPRLAACCIGALLKRTGVPAGRIDEVILGNVVSAGMGQNPARQAAMLAGLPPSAVATTVNKVCGSGLQAVMLADRAIRLGEAAVVVAGGMESMSLAPYLLPKAREGYRLGHGELIDSLIHDGLRDAHGGQLMGIYGDRCAAEYGFSRADQDDYAVRSYTRALEAVERGAFAEEIEPVEVAGKGGTATVAADEGPGRFDEKKLRGLRPAFGPGGTVTAGNASSISDGAAALLVASSTAADELGLVPVARIVGGAAFGREPEWFTLAPVGALKRLLGKLGWEPGDVDLYEINEAFAAVTMAAGRELGLPAGKVNIHGGAVALGHPIGCSGARILVTLLTGLKRIGGRRGVATLCIGGGEAVALAVEMV